jgi:hypothetical protein
MMGISDCVYLVLKTRKQMSFKQTERSLLPRMLKEYCYVSTFQFLLDSLPSVWIYPQFSKEKILCWDFSLFHRETGKRRRSSTAKYCSRYFGLWNNIETLYTEEKLKADRNRVIEWGMRIFSEHDWWNNWCLFCVLHGLMTDWLLTEEFWWIRIILLPH